MCLDNIRKPTCCKYKEKILHTLKSNNTEARPDISLVIPSMLVGDRVWRGRDARLPGGRTVSLRPVIAAEQD